MRIAIAGAGIAGLSAALALSRDGHEVTIVERRTGFGETGAGIQLSPNVTRLIDSWGLASAIARSACEPDEIAVMALPSGRPIGAVGLGRRMRERFGAPYLAIARSDLHTILLDAVRGRPGVAIRVGRAITAARDAGDAVHVTATSDRGTATLEADLLVATDGINSTLRASVARHAPWPAGFSAFRTVLPRDAWPPELGPPGGSSLWLGRDRHLVRYPIAHGSRINLVLVARAASPPGAGWSETVQPRQVVDALGPAPDALRGLVAAATWSGWTLRDMRTTRMARGRIALLGDAAHPVLPYLAQGGAMAIEDAAVLTAELRRDRPVADSLQAFEQARLPRVRKVQDAARRNGRAYHAGWPVAAVRDAIIGRLGPDGMTERYAWLYGWTGPA